jgi:hypothetical protein
MGYRAVLDATPETVQEINLSAERRLRESLELFVHNHPHSAIYLGGLAAEMFLKGACFMVGGAALGTPVAGLLNAVRPARYRPPFAADFEAGHGLWFWSQELLQRRRARSLRSPNRFLQVLAALYNDWYISMRYRPGSATSTEAAVFLMNVEWLATNHNFLRR